MVLADFCGTVSFVFFRHFGCAVIVVAFGFAPIAFLHERGALAGFADSPNSPWSYLTSNALLRIQQWGIRGLFGGLAFNLPLWSLWPEFVCYLSVAALGLLGVLKRKRGIVAILFAWGILFFAVAMWEFGQHPPPVGQWVVGVSICFSAGSCAYLFRERIPMRWWIAALCLAALAMLPTKEFLMVVIPCLAYLTIFVAMKLPFQKFDRRMDFSYGLYIYGYPIQKMLTMYKINAFGLAPYVGSALAISVAFAAASWFSVEKPFLSLKHLTLGRFVAGRPTTRADIS